MTALDVHIGTVDIHPRRPFAIARGTATAYTSVIVELARDSLNGLGEARPIPRYHDDHLQVETRLEAAADRLTSLPVDDGPDAWYPQLLALFPDSAATRSAVDMALWDLRGKMRGESVRQLLDAPEISQPSSFTLTLGSEVELREQLEAATGHPILKVKLGGEWDSEALALLADYSRFIYRFDANEGWDMARAEALLPLMEALKVDLIEQPFPAGRFEAVRQLREATSIPLVADEDCQGLGDVIRLAGTYDGVNIKLVKCGGITVARQMIERAAEAGLQVMLGCMVESSLGVTAMAQLGGFADFLDLDGAALLADDPFMGMEFGKGSLTLPTGPGLGVKRVG
ncbi:MAG: dipeptide epimerase [Candidatus Marinimicrobia bacterium]|nr:dipeptide epimerase [Candidatus Neomarinimicrobiota bacterium]